MKYCLSATQSKEYLQKANEIAVSWKDIDHIIDLIEINPNASFVIQVGDRVLTKEDWDKIEQYYLMAKKNLKVELYKMEDFTARNRGIPFFFSHAIAEPWELNAVIDLGVCSARITGELAHNLDYLDTLSIEIRVWPHKSCAPFGYKALVGGWFRPEDFDSLTAIDMCDFDPRDMREEQALYRIYAEQKAWPGPLSMLVKDIEDDAIINRMIPPSFQERRGNCRMRCQSGGHCHFCDIVTHLANPDLLKPVKEQIKNAQRNTDDESGETV